MATRLAFSAAHRVQAPVLKSASSFQIPTLSFGPRTVSFRRAALLARSSTTSTARVAEVSTRSARSKQQPPPATSSPPPPVQATAQQFSDAAAATAGSSSAKDSAAKQSPNFETRGSSNSSDGKSSTTADTTAAAASAASKQAPKDSDSAQKGTSDEHTTNSSGGGGGGGGGGGSSNGGQGGHRGPLTWGAVGLLGIVGALVMGYYRMKWDEKQKRVSSEVTSTGKPALGGPFTLVDMHGRPVTDKDFHGTFVLLYFGFCHCPDICPSELVKVGAIAKKLEAKLGGGVVKPVFVSVDPDRDSLAQLRHYAQDFHPSIQYLTGTKDQVAKAAKAYRVYFSKTEEHDEDEDYMLDHSIVIYLLAPNGEFLDFYTQRATITDCVERTVKQVKEFKAQEA